jgi:hypothetical protein
MSQVAFSARFTVLSSIPVPGYIDRWVVHAQILDMESTFYAHDVQLDFSVFLDTGAMYPDSGPVSQYSVVQIVSVHNPAFNDIQVVLEYVDSGSPVDPVVASYVPCFICETSNEGFSWMASADSQIISSRIVDYARNKDMTERLDTNLAGKADKSDLETETHLITAPEAAAKRFTIGFMPAVPSEVVADVVGGVTASFADDFIIIGNEFVWEGLGFDGLLGTGDQVRLVYIK